MTRWASRSVQTGASEGQLCQERAQHQLSDRRPPLPRPTLLRRTVRALHYSQGNRSSNTSSRDYLLPRAAHEAEYPAWHTTSSEPGSHQPRLLMSRERHRQAAEDYSVLSEGSMHQFTHSFIRPIHAAMPCTDPSPFMRMNASIAYPSQIRIKPVCRAPSIFSPIHRDTATSMISWYIFVFIIFTRQKQHKLCMFITWICYILN